MSFRSKPWRIALAVLVLGAAAFGVFRWLRNSSYDAGRLLAMLPAERATLVFIDTGALRKNGLLGLVAG